MPKSCDRTKRLEAERARDADADADHRQERDFAQDQPHHRARARRRARCECRFRGCGATPCTTSRRRGRSPRARVASRPNDADSNASMRSLNSASSTVCSIVCISNTGIAASARRTVCRSCSGNAADGRSGAADVDRHLVELVALLDTACRRSAASRFSVGRALPHVGVERILHHADDLDGARVVHARGSRSAGRSGSRFRSSTWRTISLTIATMRRAVDVALGELASHHAAACPSSGSSRARPRWSTGSCSRRASARSPAPGWCGCWRCR